MLFRRSHSWRSMRLYFARSLELLRLYRELGGEIVTVGSDGHSCRSAFSGLETGYQVLRDAGFSYAASFEKRIPTFYKI